MNRTILAATLLLLTTSSSQARTLQVGPDQTYALPSQAAAAAQDGDTVEIEAGDYPGDVAVWRANDLTIRGIHGFPRITAAGQAAEQKGIWVIHGDNVTVEDVDLSGAVVADRNGAGIRAEGVGLTVRDCRIHDNQDGILADASPGDVTVEDCVFRHNGAGDGYSHDLYIGHVRRFVLRGCSVRDSVVGHDVKSRAQQTDILYNKIADLPSSNSGNLIDLPNGGDCRIIGNILQRRLGNPDNIMIRFGEEGETNSGQSLNLINNTIVGAPNVTIVQITGHPTTRIINNLCAGCAIPTMKTTSEVSHNVTVTDAAFQNATQEDFHLAENSPAANAGADPGQDAGMSLVPVSEFQEPAATIPRPARQPLDIGAYARR